MKLTEAQFKESYERISDAKTKKPNCGYHLEDVVVALTTGVKPPVEPACPDSKQQGLAVLKNLRIKPGSDRKARKIDKINGTVAKTDVVAAKKRLSIKLDDGNIQLSSAGGPMIATQIELVIQDFLNKKRASKEVRDKLEELWYPLSQVMVDLGTKRFSKKEEKERILATNQIQEEIVKVILLDEEFQLRLLYELVTGQLLFGDDSEGRADWLVSPDSAHDFTTYEAAEDFLRNTLFAQWWPRVSHKTRKKAGEEIVFRMEPKLKHWMTQAKSIKREYPDVRHDTELFAQELRASNPDALFHALTL